MTLVEIDISFDVRLDGDSNIKSLNSPVPYNEFYNNFILKNLPCIIKNVSNTWECSNKWINNETINWNYFIDNYGNLEAPVADCSKINFNAHCKSNMKVSEYMQYLQNDMREKILYLKDWHLRKQKPDDLFYQVPLIFSSDWLNEFALDNKEDDFMFVYIGPKNSWTPLHVDVYHSYSWSVNVIGKKKWILFPPGEEKKLQDTLGNLPMQFQCGAFENVRYFEVVQEKGDAIFVPSGWYHQVTNEHDTISINHNWINAGNIEIVYQALSTCLLSVEHEIKEYKSTPDYTTQCQLILKSIFGMDYVSFIRFVCHIAKKRVQELTGTKQTILGQNHIKFDLNTILKLMDLIEKHPLFLDDTISVNLTEFNETKFTAVKLFKK